MKNFALIGVISYTVPSHANAIKETNNKLLINLIVLELWLFILEKQIFFEIDRFDRHVEKLKHYKKIELDYFSVYVSHY